MNTISQAGQSVSGATPQRNRPPIHPTSPNFLRHLQEIGLLLDFSKFHFNNKFKFLITSHASYFLKILYQPENMQKKKIDGFVPYIYIHIVIYVQKGTYVCFNLI